MSDTDTLEQRRRGYYYRAAQRRGVPMDDLEDAVQDIAIKVWQSDAPWRAVVYFAAIDAARRYGPISRRGIERGTVELTEAHAPTRDHSWLPAWLDCDAALRKLSASQRRIIAKRLAERPMTSGDSSYLHQVRRILRARTEVRA